MDNLMNVDWTILLGVGLLALAGLGVAAYFILRRMFDRAADRVSDHIGRVLAELVTKAAVTPVGRRTAAGARAATGRWTHMGAYAAAEGISEEQARRQFAQSIERTARLMDSAITLPIVGPVGLDALLGLFPVAGDALSAAVSVSLIARSIRYGVPNEIIARMLGNVLIDMLLGAVPLVGDVGDILFRANLRNVALLREYLGDEARNTIDVTPIRST
jgi:Domain of unknown function (DUF4112)